MKSLSDKIEQQKNYEYRDSFRWVLMGLIVMLSLCAILMATVCYKIIFPGEVKYYASVTTGQVIPLPSLAEPVVTDAYILEWSKLAARAALSLDFVSYSKQLEAASVYFTTNGWKAFSSALDSSGLLETLRSKKISMSAIIPSSPIIRFTGVLRGRYVWRISMPVLVTFGTASDQVQRRLEVTMVVSRVPVLDTPEGIKITDFQSKQ